MSQRPSTKPCRNDAGCVARKDTKAGRSVGEWSPATRNRRYNCSGSPRGTEPQSPDLTQATPSPERTKELVSVLSEKSAARIASIWNIRNHTRPAIASSFNCFPMSHRQLGEFFQPSYSHPRVGLRNQRWVRGHGERGLCWDTAVCLRFGHRTRNAILRFWLSRKAHDQRFGETSLDSFLDIHLSISNGNPKLF